MFHFPKEDPPHTINLINIYEHLKRDGRQMDEAGLFSVVPTDRTTDNDLKLQDGKFHKNMWKFFLVRVMEHCNRFLREIVESPSMQIFMTHLDAYLCDLL